MWVNPNRADGCGLGASTVFPVRAMFGLYAFVIAAGVAYFLVVGVLDR
jgi:hypothetical protein